MFHDIGRTLKIVALNLTLRHGTKAGIRVLGPLIISFSNILTVILSPPRLAHVVNSEIGMA